MCVFIDTSNKHKDETNLREINLKRKVQKRPEGHKKYFSK